MSFSTKGFTLHCKYDFSIAAVSLKVLIMVMICPSIEVELMILVSKNLKFLPVLMYTDPPEINLAETLVKLLEEILRDTP